jgi:GNAT superfamily N-acetyltransferase
MTLPDSRVRVAGVEEAASIGRLLDRFNREFDEPTPGPASLTERIARLLCEGETVVLAAEEGPAGIAVLRFRPAIWSEGLECYLAELYVVPERRREGLGRGLMEAALELARARGADSMDLGSEEGDRAAHALYESLGFSNRGGRPDGELSFFFEREL